MSDSGLALEFAMYLSYGCLVLVLLVRPLGLWLWRWAVGFALTTVAFYLWGHAVVPIFGREPWHSLMVPVVEWADGLGALGIPMPREVAGSILVPIAGAFIVSAAWHGDRQRKAKSEHECPFDRGGKESINDL